MSLALRGGRGAFLLEKWYLDTLLPDGGVLIVYLAWMRILGVPIGRVTAELFEADGSVRAGASPARRVLGGASSLAFGPARIDGERLAFATDGLAGELRFRPRRSPVEPRMPFLEQDGRRLLWTIEVPDADVSGELRWPGGGRSIVGRGYRDRVWFDLPPWRFPIRELLWGRAIGGDHSVAWVRATTAGETIAFHVEDGRAGRGEPPTLRDSRVLVDSDVADLAGLRLGILGPLLRRMTGDPHETKWRATATVAGEDARAVHEKVVWR